MNTTTANLVNAFSLISLSLWGYFSSDTPSMTALIPTFIGFILLLCTKGIKAENKTIAHIAVFLTLLGVLGLTMALKGAISRDDIMAILRVSIMVLTSIFAMITFVQSFIRNRKEKNM
tara:strand:- start:260 stop:613 length:354 start_codon:yes stop_codon:yes gene_type:complete